MAEKIFGHIPGIPVGSFFASRKELLEKGVHRQNQAGISYIGDEGADSIVLSDGYEDDVFEGSTIIYTGQGGRDPNSERQVRDQELVRGNRGLFRSRQNALPVRVIKKVNGGAKPYCYLGLYIVEDCWHSIGKSGFLIWRFRLTKIDDDLQPASPVVTSDSENAIQYPTTLRQTTTYLRVVRDSQKARLVKNLYDYSCQVCHARLEGSAGPYAEAAHIQPIGRPHNGPDVVSNLLCLCPNHHVLFDNGGFTIDDSLELINTRGQLKSSEKRLVVDGHHDIDPEFLRYHREHYFVG